MGPRIWLWIGGLLLAIGAVNAVQRGGFGSAYEIGYLVGSLGIGLAIIYFGWYRRRGR